jgi:hypothetical protein
MLLWQFAVPILWANVLAWPLAYFFVRRWLDGFTSHVDMNPLIFLAISALALVIALVTVRTFVLLEARFSAATYTIERTLLGSLPPKRPLIRRSCERGSQPVWVGIEPPLPRFGVTTLLKHGIPITSCHQDEPSSTKARCPAPAPTGSDGPRV